MRLATPLPLSTLAAALLLSAGPVLAQGVALKPTEVASFSNLQDSIALNYYYPTDGLFPRSDEIYGYVLGMPRISASTIVPYGMRADGRSLSTAANSALWAVTGNTFGSGNGTFKVPNLLGRTVVGATTANTLPPVPSMNWALGQTGGTAKVQLTEANLPSHIHTVPNPAEPFGPRLPTLPSGGGVPFNNVQPSLALTYGIVAKGDFPTSGVVSDYGLTMGMVLAFAGNTALAPGVLPADGRLLSIAGNESLFTVLGTTYGGNGTTNFALPDLRGRTVVGAGERPGAAFGAILGQAFGDNVHTLTVNEMPQHRHVTADDKFYTDDAGKNARFDNSQPSLALNYLISTAGPKPTGTDADKPSSELSFVGDIIAFAGSVNGNSLPGGFLLADGRALKISDYQALFDSIGYTYSGRSAPTPAPLGYFNLPDLRGRTVIGAGGEVALGGSGLLDVQAASEAEDIVTYHALGDTPGDTLPMLTFDNLPNHNANPAPVPEPATGLLAAAGGLLVALRVRRQRRLAAA